MTELYITRWSAKYTWEL